MVPEVSEKWKKIAENDEFRPKHFLRARKRGKEELHQHRSWVLLSESLVCSASLNMWTTDCKGPLTDRRLEATDAWERRAMPESCVILTRQWGSDSYASRLNLD